MRPCPGKALRGIIYFKGGFFLMKIRKKRSWALIISAVLGLAYSIYIVTYFSGLLNADQSGAEFAGSAIATALVTPHMVCVVLATIFNIIAALGNKRGFALVGAILYCVAAVVFLMYALFVLPSIVLSFIGYARLGKLNKTSQSQEIQI